MTQMEFNTLVVENSRTLKRYALKLTKNNDDAEDLIQETLCKALTNRDQFKGGTNMGAWLYTIMKNFFVNACRKRNRIVSVAPDDLSEMNQNRWDYNQGESKMELEIINKAIDKVPYNFSHAFRLHYDGYKYNEIADMLHLPLGTVKTRIYCTRKMLQKQF